MIFLTTNLPVLFSRINFIHALVSCIKMPLIYFKAAFSLVTKKLNSFVNNVLKALEKKTLSRKTKTGYISFSHPPPSSIDTPQTGVPT